MAGTDFGNWQKEKAIQALVDEAQAVAERLASGKPHAVEQHAAAAQFWAQAYLAEGVDLTTLATWKAAEVARFVRGAQSKIAALRKARDYVSSDGLAAWLHTARAVTDAGLPSPIVAPEASDEGLLQALADHGCLAGPETPIEEAR